MDALEYRNMVDYMCDVYYYSPVSCAGCPLAGKRCQNIDGITDETIKIVEEWQHSAWGWRCNK